MANYNIYDPLKMYNDELKYKVDEKAKAFYDTLIKESKVDKGANDVLYKEYQKECNTLQLLQNKTGSKKTWNGLLTALFVFSIVGIIASIAFLVIGVENIVIPIVILVISIIFALFSILYKQLKLKNDIRALELQVNKQIDKVNKLKNELIIQVTPLMKLLEWNMHTKVINEAVPLIHIDDTFDNERLWFLMRNFNYVEESDENTSILNVVSGTMAESPFLIIKQRNMKIVPKTYFGERVITWTERDSDGNTVTRSEVLTASITRPAPHYTESTYLVFGNDAAPDLTFHRVPVNIDVDNDKKVEKYVNKQGKKLDKLSEKALTDNNPDTNFQVMGNKKFETLFGATNRNNEVQFRLLFTPLAQVSEVNLILDSPFKDDFQFEKLHKLNFICSMHSQNQNYYSDPSSFFSLEVQNSKDMFVSFVNSYFRSLFFDLAPLLAIPLYQQQKTPEQIYNREFNNNYTIYESESIANGMNQELLKPKDSKTQNILKSSYVRSSKDTDIVKIIAHSFLSFPEIEYVQVMGGDGYFHTVDVPWERFEPTEQESMIGVKRYKGTMRNFDEKVNNNEFDALDGAKFNKGSIINQKGLVAFLTDGEFNIEDDELLEKLLNQ